MSRTLWRFLDRAILPSEHIEAKVMEFLRKGILTKRQTINGQGQELVMTELNPAHPLVQDALPGFAGHQFDFDVAEDEFQEDEYEDRMTTNRSTNSRISKTTGATWSALVTRGSAVVGERGPTLTSSILGMASETASAAYSDERLTIAPCRGRLPASDRRRVHRGR